MKKAIQSFLWFIANCFFLYIPLSFSALSLNPFLWGHGERFVFGMFVWIGLFWILVVSKTKYANLKIQ